MLPSSYPARSAPVPHPTQTTMNAPTLNTRHLVAVSALAVLFAWPGPMLLAQTAGEKSSPTPATATGPSPETAKRLATDLAAPAPSGTPSATAKAGDEVLTLSPFVVTTDRDAGYLANNTMSGTRLNSRLEDLGASISVITKEQLLDFVSIDLNDVFAMEVSTEGTHTYSPNGPDARGGDVDNVSLNPTTSNRIRGLGAANMSIAGTAMTSTIPVDTYNVDAVEISRGANSSIFGVGEVSGTVNLVPSAAILNRNARSVSVSGSNFGTLRSTMDVNHVLVDNRLGLRILGVAENRGFERQPAFDKTRRLTLSMTARPFRNTTLRISQEWFEQVYSRPNSMMPRDLMTIWEGAGRPAWDPLTNTWSYTDRLGVVQTGTQIVSPTGLTNFPTGVWLQGLSTGRVRPTMFIDGGKAQWFGPTVWNSTNAAFPVRELANFFVPTNVDPFYGRPNGYIPSTNPNVAGTLGYQSILSTVDKSFYDYENINLAALNWATKDAKITRIQLEQFIITTKEQVLAAQLTYNREVVDDYTKAFVGNGGDGVNLSIVPDVNKNLPDGRPNPYFGAPHISALSPQIYSRPVDSEIKKLNVAYEIDLSRRSSWLRFLGKQKIVGYVEEADRIFAPQSVRWSDQISATFPSNLMSANSSAPAGVNVPWMNIPASGNFSRDNRAIWNARYYMGLPALRGVIYAPSAPDLSGAVNYRRWGNDASVAGTSGVTAAAANTWLDTPVSFEETYFTLGMQQTNLKTKGLVWQPMLFTDRIVGTIGVREDTMKVRNGPSTWAASPAGARNADGLITSDDWLTNFSSSPWLVQDKRTGSIKNSGRTTNLGLVLKPFAWLHLRYSESDSFKPSEYVLDFDALPLPNPNGKTRDIGIRLSMLDNRLVANLTRFETSSKDARPGAGVAARALAIDFDTPANSVNLDLQDWLATEYGKLYPTETPAQLEARANQLMGITSEYADTMRNNPLAITQDVQSEGYELELYYNPSRFWTVKATASQTETMISAYGPGFQAHLDNRLPLWTTVVSPFDKTTKFWDAAQPQSNTFTTARDWYTNLVENPMKLTLAQRGLPQPQVRKYRVGITSSYRLAGLTENRFLKAMTAGGSLRWEDKGALGFYGAPGVKDPANSDPGKVFVREFDVTRPIYDSAHTYLDLFWKYDFRMMEKVRCSLQLNVRNVTESGRLQPVGVNPDATVFSYRIIDPREFTLTARFDF